MIWIALALGTIVSFCLGLLTAALCGAMADADADRAIADSIAERDELRALLAKAMDIPPELLEETP